ncbi:MAG: TetR family transcriptional regulator [Actinomycetota bacterium]
MTIDEVLDETSAPATRGDARRAAIHRAAIAEFSTQGIAGASMARIARGAGVSRPALYQYFANKEEIFASAFVALFEGHVERAVDELQAESSVADQLDGFLQRFTGDLWEHMAASEHADEIESAKTGEVARAVGELLTDLWRELDQHLATLVPGRSARIVARRRGWGDLLQLSAKGLRADQPTIDVYRERLRALAESVAADIEGTRA